MLGYTHTILSITGVAIVTGTVNPYVLLLAAVGSQIPDLDTTKSWVGKVFYPLSAFLEKKYSHRSLTHSAFLTLLIAIATTPLLIHFDFNIWLALPLGHLISCFSDCATKLGCQFFYPINKDYWVIGLNPHHRIETGKAADYAILMSAFCIFCITYYLIEGSGGIGAHISKTFFPNNQTAIEILRRENQKAVAIQVEGTRKSDNSRIDERFWAISVSGSMLIARDSNQKIFRVGESGEIIPKKVNILPDRLSIKIRHQRIEETSISEWANSLPDNALVSGNLEIEDSTELNLPILPPGTMPVLSKATDGISLEHASRDDLKPIEDFFILSGQVLIKQL